MTDYNGEERRANPAITEEMMDAIAEPVWWADALPDTDRATYEADAKAWFGTP